MREPAFGGLPSPTTDPQLSSWLNGFETMPCPLSGDASQTDSLRVRAPENPRLILRFALTTLLVFAAVAAALWWVLGTIIRERTESAAEEHAQFVVHSVIAPAVEGL